MKKWQIENLTTAHVLGTYEAEDEIGALDAMAREAGYSDHREATKAAGSAMLSVRAVEDSTAAV